MADFRTTVTPDGIVFRYPDPGHHLVDVRLAFHLDLPGFPRELDRVDGGWAVQWPLPPLDRLEYQFFARHPAFHDAPTFVTDPGNPHRIEAPFGAISCLELPGYHRPAWLDQGAVSGRHTRLSIPGTPIGDVEATVWAPGDAEPPEPLPLIVAQDGPEFDRLGGLTAAVAAFVAAGRMPATRVALLTPIERNGDYSANPRYADALAGHLVPAITAAFATRGRPILAGVSLGALAALHTEWTYPGTAAGLLLLSGSFFLDAFDSHESGFPHWARLRAFVDDVHQSSYAGAPQPDSGRLPIALGWGTAEENRHNNAAMTARLEALGFPTVVATRRDGHVFTCWRDLLDPLLPALATTAWPIDRSYGSASDSTLDSTLDSSLDRATA